MWTQYHWHAALVFMKWGLQASSDCQLESAAIEHTAARFPRQDKSVLILMRNNNILKLEYG